MSRYVGGNGVNVDVDRVANAGLRLKAVLWPCLRMFMWGICTVGRNKI